MFLRSSMTVQICIMILSKHFKCLVLFVQHKWLPDSEHVRKDGNTLWQVKVSTEKKLLSKNVRFFLSVNGYFEKMSLLIFIKFVLQTKNI